MHDRPEGARGGLHKKASGIFADDEDVAEVVDLRCDGSHTHETVQGVATKASENYSDGMAERIATAMLKGRGLRKSTRGRKVAP